jgi:hypothetical protein
MKQTIGDLWSRFTNPANWQMEPRHLEKTAATAALDRFSRVLEIDRYGIAIEEGVDGWVWSIYRGKAEWYSYLVEGVWSPINYADENEARAVAWTMLMRAIDPKWPPEPEDVLEDMYDGSAP